MDTSRTDVKPARSAAAALVLFVVSSVAWAGLTRSSTDVLIAEQIGVAAAALIGSAAMLEVPTSTAVAKTVVVLRFPRIRAKQEANIAVSVIELWSDELTWQEDTNYSNPGWLLTQQTLIELTPRDLVDSYGQDTRDVRRVQSPADPGNEWRTAPRGLIDQLSGPHAGRRSRARPPASG